MKLVDTIKVRLKGDGHIGTIHQYDKAGEVTFVVFNPEENAVISDECRSFAEALGELLGDWLQHSLDYEHSEQE